MSTCCAARERTSQRSGRSTETTMGITDRRLFDGRETLKEFPCTGFW
jgi:hypothetical protein